MGRKLTGKELKQGLLRGLTNERNPITHSDARDRAGESLVFQVPLQASSFTNDRE
jgi:hypothetical protein